MIHSILLKNVASYDPEYGVEISDLKRLNFFFGANGSGKSTIAKYLYNIGQEIDNRIELFKCCTNHGYNEEDHHILVYDENFVEVNFNRNSLLKGVFSLNETNDNIDKQISSKQIKIQGFADIKANKKSLKESLEKDLQKKNTQILEFCWDKRIAFNSFTKLKLEFRGSKPNHLNKLKQVLDDIPKHIPTIRELTDNYNKYYEKEIAHIQITVNSNLYKEIRYLEIKIAPLLSKIIIGNEDVEIDDLIKSLASRSWVKSGLEFIMEEDNTCPFCQQKTIDESLRSQFNLYFDETSKKEIENIEQLLIQYKEKTNSFLENIFEIQSLHNPKSILSKTYICLQQIFADNIRQIESKIQNSNERKKIVSLNTVKSSLSTIIKSIKANNQSLLQLDQNKNNLISSIWIYMANESRKKIEEFNLRTGKYQRINELADELIAKYDFELNNLEREIEFLRSKTVNTQDAVNNINLILKNSGFESFEIREKDRVNKISQYYLKRPNSTNEDPIFNTLSEGEKSFISFLYFHQLCIGIDENKAHSTKKKIIVIDDPVSSLDSQSLFVISSLIHQLILKKSKNSPDKKLFKDERIEQVFILTHNLYFYNEVSFAKRPMCTDFWHYKISKLNNISQIEGQKDKIIKDDYTLLWSTIKELKSNLPQNSDLNILIANSMRRIIESYVHFIGMKSDVWSSILNDDKLSPKYYLKNAFLASINDESHKVTVFDGVYYQKVSNALPQLLFDVFKDIFSNIGKEHYEMMMNEHVITE